MAEQIYIDIECNDQYLVQDPQNHRDYKNYRYSSLKFSKQVRVHVDESQSHPHRAKIIQFLLVIARSDNPNFIPSILPSPDSYEPGKNGTQLEPFQTRSSLRIRISTNAVRLVEQKPS